MENTLAHYTLHHPRILGLRRSALIEMLIFFVVILLINMVIPSSPRFIGAWFHPFYVIVILISAQYGSNEGIVCAFLASLVLLLGNVPAQSMNQDMYGWLFEVAKLPLTWLLIAVVLGELRQRHLREREALIEELQESHKREHTFATTYEKIKERKDRLELNMAGRVRTEIGALRAAKAIEKLDPEHVIDGVAEMVRSAMGAEKFSLYLMQGDQLQRHISQGWSEAEEKTLPHTYRSHDVLFQAMVVRRDVLTVKNADDERVLNGQGIMATPLLDTDTNQVLGMLKIESIPFLELTMETVEIFRALGEWIALALANARYYQTAMDDSIVNPEHNLMTRSFFNRYRDYITALARRLKFNVFMLNVSVANYEHLSGDDKVHVARQLANTVDETLRTVDFAFDHQQLNGNYGIILPATDAAGAQVVRDKIERELKRTMQTVRGVRLDFSLTALHEV